jgi:hypothetical protein
MSSAKSAQVSGIFFAIQRQIDFAFCNLADCKPKDMTKQIMTRAMHNFLLGYQTYTDITQKNFIRVRFPDFSREEYVFTTYMDSFINIPFASAMIDFVNYIKDPYHRYSFTMSTEGMSMTYGLSEYEREFFEKLESKE